jgi:hypothetical protein
LATGYAFHASRFATAKYPAYVGLALAGAELLLILAFMIIGAIAMVSAA